MLDEPTNHLDIPSKEMLEEALQRFDGSVIAVSHDRYFLRRIATRVVTVRLFFLPPPDGSWARNDGHNMEQQAMTPRLTEAAREMSERRQLLISVFTTVHWKPGNFSGNTHCVLASATICAGLSPYRESSSLTYHTEPGDTTT